MAKPKSGSAPACHRIREATGLEAGFANETDAQTFLGDFKRGQERSCRRAGNVPDPPPLAEGA